VQVTVSGKLRGSMARQLGEFLEQLGADGARRVVLDLTALTSLDSVATMALEEALGHGVKLHLVVRPAFEFDPFFRARSLGRRGLRVHHSLEEAVARARQIVDSGMVLA
jgi:hypothetical protein